MRIELENVRARKQRTSWTCGPASLRSIFFHYGLTVSEKELVQEGVDKEQVSHALKKNMKEICKLTVDKVEFLPQGTFSEKDQWVVDTRTYE
jgi:hypothetical protein